MPRRHVVECRVYDSPTWTTTLGDANFPCRSTPTSMEPMLALVRVTTRVFRSTRLSPVLCAADSLHHLTQCELPRMCTPHLENRVDAQTRKAASVPDPGPSTVVIVVAWSQPLKRGTNRLYSVLSIAGTIGAEINTTCPATTPQRGNETRSCLRARADAQFVSCLSFTSIPLPTADRIIVFRLRRSVALLFHDERRVRQRKMTVTRVRIDVRMVESTTFIRAPLHQLCSVLRMIDARTGRVLNGDSSLVLSLTRQCAGSRDHHRRGIANNHSSNRGTDRMSTDDAHRSNSPLDQQLGLNERRETTTEGMTPAPHPLAVTATIAPRAAVIVAEDVIGEEGATVVVTLDRRRMNLVHGMGVAAH